jgi:acetoin utilization deacetylase AcuC-like enzyme
MSKAPVYLSHASSLEHDTGAHPERSLRIEETNRVLGERDYLGYERVESPAANRAMLERVHSTAHIDLIEAASGRGGAQLDPDTVVSPGSYGAALHAAGGAVEMVRRLVEGGAGQIGFSAHRPPGHHALADRAMGFCLFNNVAVAARHAVAELGLERVLILDWDVHHGNGTHDTFWDSREVLFVSIHQSPLWPGSGRATELGGEGALGHTVNLPVPPGSGDAEFVSLVRDVVVPLGRAYRPQLVLVSAGYDAHADDPLAECELSDAGFVAMAAHMRDLARELEIPLGCVLEGGYDVRALSRCVAATMQELVAGPAPDRADGVAVHRLASSARERLAPWWPDL